MATGNEHYFDSVCLCTDLSTPLYCATSLSVSIGETVSHASPTSHCCAPGRGPLPVLVAMARELALSCRIIHMLTWRVGLALGTGIYMELLELLALQELVKEPVPAL